MRDVGDLFPDREPMSLDLPYARQIAVIGLLVLFGTVVWFALTAEKQPPPVEERPARTTGQQGVTEQRITMNDGRTMTCLLFPGNAVSCDWAHAYRGL